MPIKYSLSLKV